MDCDIPEAQFWEMTIAELTRAIESANRKKKREEKERASFDYILASMIARGVQSAINGGEGIPEINEVYGTLFDEDIEDKKRKKQEAKMQLSALRFKQYANFHNNKISNGGGEQLG